MVNSKLFTMMAGVPRSGTSMMSPSIYFNWPDQWIVDIAKDIQSKELMFNQVTFGVSLNMPGMSGKLLAFSWELKHVFDSGWIVILEEE
jgi:hypothetical protein